MLLAGNFPSSPFFVVAVPRRYTLTNTGEQEPLPPTSLTRLRDAILKGALTAKPDAGDVRTLSKTVLFLIVGGCHTYASLEEALAMVRMHVRMFRCVFP